jgi:hypothetical protein
MRINITRSYLPIVKYKGKGTGRAFLRKLLRAFAERRSRAAGHDPRNYTAATLLA